MEGRKDLLRYSTVAVRVLAANNGKQCPTGFGFGVAGGGMQMLAWLQLVPRAAGSLGELGRNLGRAAAD